MTDWITVHDAAERIKASDDTIRRMIAREEIIAKRFGPRLIRIDAASLKGNEVYGYGS